MPNNVGMQNTSPVGCAAQFVGGLTVLARILEVAPPTVHEWKVGKRPVPAARCLAIELATQGTVTRKQLRPDDWHKYWPELAQAPATIAQPAAEAAAGQGA